MKETKTIGFIFGYKETTKNDDNSFSVKFLSGITNKYPKKFESKKDFWYERVFEGQFYNLFIDPAVFEQAMNYRQLNPSAFS